MSQSPPVTLSGAPSTRRRYAIVSLVVLCAVGLFLIAMASANTALFAKHYRTLLLLNGTIAALLAALVLAGASQKLPAGTASAVIAWFEGRAPQTADGALALGLGVHMMMSMALGVTMMATTESSVGWTM